MKKAELKTFFLVQKVSGEDGCKKALVKAAGDSCLVQLLE